MNRWLAALVVALVFASGVGVGVLGTIALQHLHGHRPPPILHLQNGLGRGLGLTAEQTERLHQLQKRDQSRMAQMRPRLRSEIERLHAMHLEEVREMLTDEQREKFDRRIARREAVHRRRGRRLENQR